MSQRTTQQPAIGEGVAESLAQPVEIRLGECTST